MIRSYLAIATTLVLFAAMFTVLTGCAWSWSERVATSAIIVCSAVDVIQTRLLIDHGGYELNPLIGRHPSTEKMVGLKVIGLSTGFVLLDRYPKARTSALLSGELACAGGVGWNYSQGAR